MAFLRNLLATLVGLFLFSVLVIFLFIVIASATDEKPKIEPQTVLKMKLSGMVIERTHEDPFEEIFSNSPEPIGLVDVLRMLTVAKEDPNVSGIYLEPQFLSAGFASRKEIRDALIDFKSSGKFIYAYGEYISEGDFYLISTADWIFLNPEGYMEFNGLSLNVTFFKGLFDKLGIEPEIFKAGKFKGAVEPFTRQDMSDENKEQYTLILNSLFETYISDLSQSIVKQEDSLKEISRKMLVRSPELALEYGLVNQLGYKDELEVMIRQKIGLTEDEKVNFMSMNQYIKGMPSAGYSKNKIAVIVASGEIMPGDREDYVDGVRFAKEIKKARENESVKAIVLRVNSPGGSMLDSDLIRHEVMLTKGVKPIVASMSDMAASGGYYIAMGCDTIVAQPNTITGSIGVFRMMFSAQELMNDKLGITTDGVSTGEFSDIMTVSRSMTQAERDIMQLQIDQAYESFVSKVSKDRGIDRGELNIYAEGRVWTGVQALDAGLIDVLGSFEDAVRIAALMGGVDDDFKVSYYPQQKSTLDRVLSDLNESRASILSSSDPLIMKYVDRLQYVRKLEGIQMRMPGELEIN